METKDEKLDFSLMNLELVGISRQSLIDADYVCRCQKCGATIVNIARVRNLNDGKEYEIGLDCKKSLMDQKILDSFLLDEIYARDSARKFRKATKDAEFFLKALSNSDSYAVEWEFRNNTIVIRSKIKKDMFGGDLYLEEFPINYLVLTCGISKEFLYDLMKNETIKKA